LRRGALNSFLSGFPAQPASANGGEWIFSARRRPEVPWSVNIVQIDRSITEFELHTTLAHGSRID
jgi:hypothetical protein